MVANGRLLIKSIEAFNNRTRKSINFPNTQLRMSIFKSEEIKRLKVEIMETKESGTAIIPLSQK